MDTQKEQETLTAVFVESDSALDKLFVLDPELNRHVSLREASKRLQNQNGELMLTALVTSEIVITKDQKGEQAAFSNASSNCHLCQLAPGIYICLPQGVPCPNG